MSLGQDLKILYHLALSPVRGRTHEERLESFYAGQAAHYDEFRKRLLHGRKELYKRIPIPEGGVWLEMGGGTAVQSRISGRQRVEDQTGLRRRSVRSRCSRSPGSGSTGTAGPMCRCCTRTPPQVTLPEQADVVTFSYSLTMIPNWYLALENARKLLKPGGIIAVVDFYVARKHPAAGFKSHAAFTRWFWPAWFSCDNVFPSPDHLPVSAPQLRAAPARGEHRQTQVPAAGPGSLLPLHGPQEAGLHGERRDFWRAEPRKGPVSAFKLRHLRDSGRPWITFRQTTPESPASVRLRFPWPVRRGTKCRRRLPCPCRFAPSCRRSARRQIAAGAADGR